MMYRNLYMIAFIYEQTELMGQQLKRAKRRTDTQDMELAMDMMVVFSKEDGRNADIAIMERLATKLDLGTPEELREETKAVRRLSKDKRAEEHMQLILDLLNKFKQIAGIDETIAMISDDFATNKPLKSQTIKSPNIETPQEFLCPITLEIMTDPVIVSTGQVTNNYILESKCWNDLTHIDELKIVYTFYKLLDPFLSLPYGFRMVSPWVMKYT